MKKATRILALVLAIVMCIGCLAACGSSSNSGTTTAASDSDSSVAAPDPPPEYTIKIGFMSSNTHPWTTAANDFAAAVAE